MIDALYQQLVTFHQQHPYLIKAMLAGTIVSTVCGVIGCFIILRRMAFLGDAIAHAMLAGVVAGYLFMKMVFGVSVSAAGMLVGSLLAGFLTVAMVAFVSRLSRIKEDTAIGVMYTGIFAVGAMLVSLFSDRIHIDLYHFVVGTVLAIDDSQLWLMAVVAVFVLAVVILLFRPLQLISFDPVMAASIGVPVVALDYLLTACTSLVVVSAVNIVGVILVVGLLITPAATAYLVCDRLSRMLVVAAAFGFSSFVIGYLLAVLLAAAPGPSIVVTSTAQLLAVLAVAPKYGLVADWLRRRRAISQQVAEDVLGSIQKAPVSPVSLEAILEHVDAPASTVQQAIRSLEQQQLVTVSEDQMALTEAGRHEARRLRRAHRIWETYLDRLGLPPDQLHAEADRLEHVHDEAAVDYLDDKLGHPVHDPHGSEIPEDFVDLVPGTQVKASLLRTGHRGTVVQLGPQAQQTSLVEGMTISIGPRRDDDRSWTVILPDGRQLLVDHQTADAITVLLEPAAQGD